MESKLDILRRYDIVCIWKANFTYLIENEVIFADTNLGQTGECGMAHCGNRLEEFRKSKDLSQEDLAAILEVSRQTIGSLEKGRYNPSILLAFKIARYFGTSIEEIFIYEEE